MSSVVSGQMPGFCFLVCPDSLLLHRRLDERLAAFSPVGGQWERHVHWGDEEPPKSFWEQLTMQGLFGNARAVIVRQADQWPAAVWKQLSHALARPSPQCLSFFCLEVAWEKGKPKIPAFFSKLRCFVFADKQGWVWRQDGLNERGIKRHVQSRASALGLEFEQDALEQFCASVLPDASAVENELQKFVLLRSAAKAAGDAGRITSAMTALCASSPECNIFACLRHIEAGNLPAMLREVARSRDSVGLLFPLLSLLARDMRQLWRVKAGEQVRFFPFEAEFKQHLARRVDFARLSKCMALIMDAELQVKSGRLEAGQSLDFLTTELTCLFKELSGQEKSVSERNV